MTSQFADKTPSSIFLRCRISPVNFSYWSKFHVNIITGSRDMTIFFYKGLTRNREIGNTSVWVFPNNLRLGWVRDTKFGTNVSNKMLLNAVKFHSYSFYHFWVIKGKSTWRERGGGGNYPPPRLGLICNCLYLLLNLIVHSFVDEILWKSSQGIQFELIFNSFSVFMILLRKLKQPYN